MLTRCNKMSAQFTETIARKSLYLILINLVVDELVRSLILERDDDESDEDVDEEEWKDDEVEDVEDGHLHAEVGHRTLVLVRRVHRVD